MTDKEFTSIVDETKPTVLAAITKYLFKAYYEYIDDVCQDVYYKAYNGLKNGKFRGDAKLTTWLYAIARNEACLYNKRLTHNKDLFKRAVDDYRLNQDSEGYETEKLVFGELINTLPDNKRRVMELLLQNVPLADIAKQLNMNENTVKSIIYRTRKQLSELMDSDKFEAETETDSDYEKL